MAVANVSAFSRPLLAWFDQNRRDLPWRADTDPYRVWVSEIMLQQTRVAAVIERYRDFMTRFPNVQALAQAKLDAVLAAWSGLGYYRRARALHQAAQRVVAEGFPRTAAEWRALPGVGAYTAAAIASISASERCAVVDGNVVRVASRLVGRTLSVKAAQAEADAWLSPTRPGDFNQAMMELGATVCVPRNPQCDACPIRRWCTTRGEHAVQKPPARRRRELRYALATCGNCVRLVQRGNDESLMAGMWELPLANSAAAHADPLFSVRHSITTTDFQIHVIASDHTRHPRSAFPEGRWIRRDRIAALPLTGLARKILRRAKLLDAPVQ